MEHPNLEDAAAEPRPLPTEFKRVSLFDEALYEWQRDVKQQLQAAEAGEAEAAADAEDHKVQAGPLSPIVLDSAATLKLLENFFEIKEHKFHPLPRQNPRVIKFVLKSNRSIELNAIDIFNILNQYKFDGDFRVAPLVPRPRLRGQILVFLASTFDIMLDILAIPIAIWTRSPDFKLGKGALGISILFPMFLLAITRLHNNFYFVGSPHVDNPEFILNLIRQEQAFLQSNLKKAGLSTLQAKELMTDLLLFAKRNKGKIQDGRLWTEIRAHGSLILKILDNVATSVINFVDAPWWQAAIAGGTIGFFVGTDSAWSVIYAGIIRREIADYVKYGNLPPLAPHKEATGLAWIADRDFVAWTLAFCGPFLFIYLRYGSATSTFLRHFNLTLSSLEPFDGHFLAAIFYSLYLYAYMFRNFNVNINMKHLLTDRDLPNILATKTATFSAALLMGLTCYVLFQNRIVPNVNFFSDLNVIDNMLFGSLIALCPTLLLFTVLRCLGPSSRLTRGYQSLATLTFPNHINLGQSNRRYLRGNKLLAGTLLTGVAAIGLPFLLPASSFMTGWGVVTSLLTLLSIYALIYRISPEKSMRLAYLPANALSFMARFDNALLNCFMKINYQIAGKPIDTTPKTILNPPAFDSLSDTLIYVIFAIFIISSVSAAMAELNPGLPFVLELTARRDETKEQERVPAPPEIKELAVAEALLPAVLPRVLSVAAMAELGPGYPIQDEKEDARAPVPVPVPVPAPEPASAAHQHLAREPSGLTRLGSALRGSGVTLTASLSGLFRRTRAGEDGVVHSKSSGGLLGFDANRAARLPIQADIPLLNPHYGSFSLNPGGGD